jgi:TonB family protein
MAPTRTSRRIGFVLMAWLAADPTIAAGQDELARAKTLYASAAYDEALAVLDSLPHESSDGSATEAAQYRVFCLLALDRTGEARKAIEDIVNADPSYRPSDTQTSPRIRNVFQEVRRTFLPVLVQRRYAEAKAAFDRKDARAATEFDRVLALLDDPDLPSAAALADLRTVATGFRDLTKAVVLAAPAGEPLAPAARAVAGPVPSDAQTAVAALPAGRPAAPGKAPQGTPIVPPVALFQPLPPWSPPKNNERPRDFAGTLEVVIDESGNVASVRLPKSVHPLYDAELLKMARTWKFKPGTLNGSPTAYTKILEIQLHSPQ